MIAVRVALVGVTGYSGMVLYQMLAGHPHVDGVDLYGHNLTEPVALASAVPQFVGATDVVLQPYSEQVVMAQDDVVFFATSAGVTRTAAVPYITAGFPMIDLSGDLRLKQPDLYTQWYHKPAAAKQILAQTHYGLSDLQSSAGMAAIANPGCYATATLLGLAPLVQSGLIMTDSIIVDAKSGTSGAGKHPGELTHFSQANENLQVYKVNQHQHIPEILQQLQVWDQSITAIQFNTTLLPITRGLMSTIYARVRPDVTAAAIDEAFTSTFADVAGVRYTGDRLPNLKEVVGTDYCDVGAVFNPTTGMVMVVSVIDNLIKGAGGQAIQNMNQMFGFPEMAGEPVNVILP